MSNFQQFENDLRTPVTITAQQVSNILHASRYGEGQEHHMIHSCPCDRLALFYLGLRPTHGLYWPSKDGGNEWEKKNQEAMEVEGTGRAVNAERERVVEAIRGLPSFVAINAVLEAIAVKPKP